MSQSNRYLALDAFRGLTIALMILVITPGSWSHVYPPLLHADWHGWTITDLVFPFFMFIIGSAMFFSFRKIGFQASGPVLLRVFYRSLIIFSLGLFLNAFPEFNSIDQLRIMSVLGRIGLAYCIAAVCILYLSQKGLAVLSIVLLIAYWLLLMAFGGDAPYSLEDNFVRHVDLLVLGESHMWAGKGIPFDPEGVLSTLPSLVSIFAGFAAAKMIMESSNKEESLRKLLLSAVILIALGYLWSLVFPINKYLWTSSYVLLTSGIAMAVLCGFIWLMDIKGRQNYFSSLLIYGQNPLFLYVFAAVWTDCYKLIQMELSTGQVVNFRDWLFIQFSEYLAPMNASLVYALIHVSIFWCVCLFLHKKNIVIKL